MLRAPSPGSPAKLRVYLVDDSPSARLALTRLLELAEGVEVIGQAANGRRAIEEVPRLRPDIVLVDVIMLGLSGLETTRQLMSRYPVPIVLVSDVVGRRSELNFEGLAAGAVDLMRKPTARQVRDVEVARAWARRLGSLAKVPVVTRRSQVGATPGPGPGPGPSPRRGPEACALVAIGASTGGPQAIERLMREIGPRPPWPVLIAQHIAPGFQAGMCEWLSSVTGARIVVASTGEVPTPGCYYFPADGHHLSWSRTRLELLAPTPLERHCPSIDLLFHSLARSSVASQTVGVILTGMGSDGAAGLVELRSAGAWTIAESEASCVIHGMSRVAEELGGACEVLALDSIARRLRALTYAG